MNSSKTSHKNRKQGNKIEQSSKEKQQNLQNSERVQRYQLEDLRWLRCYEPFGPV